jgi:hypothetical protein
VLSARLLVIAVAVAAGVPAFAQQPVRSGKNAMYIRGQRQDVYYMPARNLPKGALNVAVVFVPGDGGWRGWATGHATLDEKQLMADMGAFGRWAQQGLDRKLIFVGWSEGAGLGVLALVPPENKKVYRGLAVFGLPERAAMGWRFADNMTWITKRDPDEPMFATGPFLPEITPAPIFVLQSTGDEWTSVAVAKKLFADAREPKLLKFIDARNHRFDGNRDEFLQALHDGIDWIARQNPQ